MKQHKVLAGVVVAVAVGIGASLLSARQAGGHEAGAPKTEKPLEFAAKELVQVRKLTLPAEVAFTGPLVAPGTAVVRAKSAGTLMSLTVGEGSRVHAGQSLGLIDQAELTARLNERMAQAEASKAQLAQAERTHVSNQRLAEQQFISPNALDASRAALDTAKAQFAAAQAQVETVRISQREAALIAPISGIVAKRHAVPGEKVAAEQSLLTIVDLRQLEMAGTVGTHEVGQLHPGMPVTLQIEGLAQPMSGTLARIAPAAEPGTRSIGVTVALANADERLRAGQFATARVTLPADEPRLTVPQTALASSSGQEYVWTLEQGRLLRRTVVTGRRDPLRGLVEVTEGLPADAQVLAVRFDNLREGALAKVVPGGTATAPAAAASAASQVGAADSASARAL